MSQFHSLESDSNNDSYAIATSKDQYSDGNIQCTSDNEGCFEDSEEVAVYYPIDEDSEEDVEIDQSINVQKLMNLQSDDESDIEKYIIPEASNSSKPSNDQAQPSTTSVKKLCFASLEPEEYLRLKKNCPESDSDCDSEAYVQQDENEPDSVHNSEAHEQQNEPVNSETDHQRKEPVTVRDSEVHEQQNEPDSVHDSKVHDQQNEPDDFHDFELNAASDASYIWDPENTVEQVRDHKPSHESNKNYDSNSFELSPLFKNRENVKKKVLKKRSSKNSVYADSSDSESSSQYSETSIERTKRKRHHNRQSEKLTKTTLKRGLHSVPTKRKIRSRYETFTHSESDEVSPDECFTAKRARTSSREFSRQKTKNDKGKSGRRPLSQPPVGIRKRRVRSDSSDQTDSDLKISDKSRTSKNPKPSTSKSSRHSSKNTNDKTGRRSLSQPPVGVRKGRVRFASNLPDGRSRSDSPDQTESDLEISDVSRSRQNPAPSIRKSSRRSSKNTKGNNVRRSLSQPAVESIWNSQDESESDKSSSSDSRISRKSRSRIRKPSGKREISRANKKVKKAKLSDPEYNASTSAEESDSPASVDDFDSDSAKENYSKDRKSTKRHSYEKAGKVGTDTRDMFKHVAHSSEGGKHYYKKNCCPYCRKLFLRLDLHLLGKRSGHRDKRTVKEILKKEPRDPERLALFATLRSAGNAQYHRDPKLNPTGKIIPVRRIASNKGLPLDHKPHLYKKNAKKNENADDSLPSTSSQNTEPTLAEKARVLADKRLAGEVNAHNKQPFKLKHKECSICKAVVANLSSHFKKMHETDESKMSTKGLMAASRKTTKLWHPAASSRLSNYILPRLNEDKYAQIVRYDHLIILYGNKYAEKYQHDEQVDFIKSQMRLLAKLVYESRKHSRDITDLASCFTSDGWGPVFKAIKKLTGYSEDSRELKNPYNGFTLGMLIKRCIIRLNRLYKGPKNALKRGELADFLADFDDDYSSTIISKATQTINHNRRKALSNQLPSDEDFKKLSSYVQEKRKLCLETLKRKGYNEEVYENLVKTTACKLEVFNKRRNLEIQRAELDDYRDRLKINRESPDFKSLSEVDQNKVKNYASLLFVQGKKTSGIDGAIYLTHEDEESIEMMKKHRYEAGISKDSIYLFALHPSSRGKQKHVSCYTTMVEISKECGAENPEALRATLLRKYATIKYSQMSNTQKSDKFYLHMAHTEATSNKFYKKVSLKDVADVTNTLEYMEQAAEQRVVARDPIIEDNEEEDGARCEDNFETEIKANIIKSASSSRRSRKSWDSQELSDLYKAFSTHLDNEKYPLKHEVNKALKNYPRLKQRGPEGIRSKIQHILKKGK